MQLLKQATHPPLEADKRKLGCRSLDIGLTIPRNDRRKGSQLLLHSTLQDVFASIGGCDDPDANNPEAIPSNATWRSCFSSEARLAQTLRGFDKVGRAAWRA